MPRTKDLYEENIQDHGLIIDDVVEGDHYMFGGYSGISDRPIINPGGDWEPYIPIAEYQSTRRGKLFDSRNCTGFGTNNGLETLAILLEFHDFPHNCSDRYTGIIAGTDQSGNSPHRVIEAIRSGKEGRGAIPEAVLPFTEDIRSGDDYYAPKPLPTEFKKLGDKISDEFEINHEWVFNGKYSPSIEEKQGLLMEALERGTIGISVRAWSRNKRTGLYRKSRGESDTHWCQLIKYKEGEWWRVFDSYDATIKDLEWDYNFECAKIYYLARRSQAEKDLKISLLQKLVSVLTEYVALLIAQGFKGIKKLTGLWKY